MFRLTRVVEINLIIFHEHGANPIKTFQALSCPDKFEVSYLQKYLFNRPKISK